MLAVRAEQTCMRDSTSIGWADGLHLTVSGLTKTQRQQVREVVESAGGRSALLLLQYSGLHNIAATETI